MPRPTLYVGNKNYSSWSLRPWLALRWAGVDFDEQVIALEEGHAFGAIPGVRAVSPTGKVPVLVIDGVTIPDSLAISEWAAEQSPALYPADATARAVCRSAAAEMHSGFAALRGALPMNIRRRVQVAAWPPEVAADIARVTTLWTALRTTYGAGGPWLFGHRSVADAFYAPVATRFRTYGVALPAPLEAYINTLYADPDFQAWQTAAKAEPWTVEEADALYG
ncbi:MAG: glutathione S-transferase [Myxococcota bacterium]